MGDSISQFSFYFLYISTLIVFRYQNFLNKLYQNTKLTLFNFMLTKTLHEIQEMSEKIQTNIKIVLGETNLRHAHSPDTDYETNAQSTKKYDKYKNFPSDAKFEQASGSHIKQFMLEEENKMLRDQVRELKQKNQNYRLQVKELKKYISFLEEYNNRLKSEVVLWMNRPVKKEFFDEETNIKRMSDFRTRLNQVNKKINDFSYEQSAYSSNSSYILNRRPDKTRKQDESNTIRVQQNPEQRQQSSQQEDSSFFEEQTMNEEKEQENWKSRPRRQLPEKINSVSLKPQCTSCHYLKSKKNSKKQKNNHQFYRNISFNQKSYKGGKKTIKRQLQKVGKKKEKRESVDNYFSFDLKDNKKSLCTCHQKYVKQRRF